jgi:hypothetical protein
MQHNASTDELLRRLARARLRPTTTKRPEPSVAWSKLSFVGFARELGIPLSDAQRVLALVAFDGLEPRDLEPEDFAIAQRLFTTPGGEPMLTIPRAARRVLTIVKGARCGGTYLSTVYVCWRALTADLSTLAPGERARGILGAPDLDLASQALSYAIGVFESHADLAAMIKRQAGERLIIERPHDGRQVEIRYRTANRGGRSFRARSLIAGVLSELAFFQDSSHVVNDEDCFRAINPRVLPGGLTILESTPWEESGLLFEEFTKNFGKPETSMAVFAPTLFFLPTERNREVVAAEEKRDPTNAAREFGGQFLAIGSSIFFHAEALRRFLAAGVGLEWNPGAPNPGELVGVGGDLGLTSDAAAFVAVHRVPEPKSPSDDERRDPARDHYQVAELAERIPAKGAPLKLGELVPLGCAMAKRHGETMVLVDQWSLQPAREHLPSGFSLVPVEPKGELERFLLARELMVENRLALPAALDKSGQPEPLEAFAKLHAQLKLVLQRPKPGGGMTIYLPKKAGTHLDLVPAFVNAVWRAKHATFSTGAPPKRRPRSARATGGY